MTDIDTWIAGAKRQRRSVLIYQRPDVIAELDEINQEVTTSRAAGLDVSELMARWDERALAFSDSKLRVTVEGQTLDEIAALKALSAAAGEDEEQESARTLADAIVSPDISREQIIALHNAIGDAQYEAILAAWRSACFDVPPLGPGVDDE